MASNREKENPATPGLFHGVMDERWHLINSLIGGTEQMRLEGTKYLPQHGREYDSDYNERLTRSILINYFDLTLSTLSGKPFTEPLQFGDDVPVEIRGELEQAPAEKSENATKDIDLKGGWIEDIDLEGNHIDQFAARVFRDGVAKGYTHILVDSPEKEPGRTYTLKDEQDEGIRPYFVHIPPENVIAANCVRQNGHEILTHMRWYEAGTKRDGFAEVETISIRAMTLMIDPQTGAKKVNVERYEKIPGKSGGSVKSWQKVDAKPTDLDYIPVFTFYSKRDGFMLSKPPLLDLAYMNVLHYQRYSDHTNALTVATFPILAASGVAPEDAGNVTIGPRNVLTLEDPNSKYYYVEHAGIALTVSKDNLTDLENQMGLYGASLLRKRPDRETATSRSIEEKNTSSDLQRMALGFKDVLENCLKAMAQIGGLGDDGGSIIIHTDFAFEGGDVVDLQTLQVAYDKRAISRVGFINELKRRGILAEDFHTDEDLKHLIEEKEKQLGAFYNEKLAEIDKQTEGQVKVTQETVKGQKDIAKQTSEQAAKEADKARTHQTQEAEKNRKAVKEKPAKAPAK